jgi:hypothetical protein
MPDVESQDSAWSGIVVYNGRFAMRHHIEKTIIVVCCLLMCNLSGGVTFAQGAAKAGKSAGGAAATDVNPDDVKLTKIIGLGSQSLVKTPEFRAGGMGARKPPADWAQITVKFNTTPEWLDELTFNFYALAKDSKDQYSFYKGTVRYIDIEKGRDHLAAMYVRPGTLKRYGPLVAIGVEVMEKGKLIGEGKEGNVADEWWKKTMGNSFTPREDCLLDRSLSPFALIAIDDYEVIK